MATKTKDDWSTHRPRPCPGSGAVRSARRRYRQTRQLFLGRSLCSALGLTAPAASPSNRHLRRRRAGRCSSRRPAPEPVGIDVVRLPFQAAGLRVVERKREPARRQIRPACGPEHRIQQDITLLEPFDGVPRCVARPGVRAECDVGRGRRSARLDCLPAGCGTEVWDGPAGCRRVARCGGRGRHGGRGRRGAVVADGRGGRGRYMVWGPWSSTVSRSACGPSACTWFDRTEWPTVLLPSSNLVVALASRIRPRSSTPMRSVVPR